MATGDSTARATRGLSRITRAKVYEAMHVERYKSTGYGFEVPVAQLQRAESVEEANEIHQRAFSLYTNAALDRLHGMAAIVAVIEGKEENEIIASLST